VPRRLTNDLLLALLLAQVLGGLLGWALPVATAAPLYDVHRAFGVAVILLLGWKQAIALRSLRKRVGKRTPTNVIQSEAKNLSHERGWDRSIVWGSIAAVALLLTLGLGLAWTLNLISFDLLWGYSPMNIHVALGTLLLPFVAWHMLARRRQNLASLPVRSRRSLLRVAGLSVATLVGWQAIERLAPAVRLPTGSKPTASFSGNGYPAEIWLLDSVPTLDAATWRLNALGRSFSLSELSDSHPRREVQAVLDCTSGWWTEQIWSGPGLLDVLRSAGVPDSATQVAVTSVTGHRIVLPLVDLENAVLATHVGDEPLSPCHGYPVRLTVPGRRGYQWVKWVASIELA
jgi:DMSO/TMAO reductase YedYZ molybdopterin-dependent catalytic subunit